MRGTFRSTVHLTSPLLVAMLNWYTPLIFLTRSGFSAIFFERLANTCPTGLSSYKRRRKRAGRRRGLSIIDVMYSVLLCDVGKSVPLKQRQRGQMQGRQAWWQQGRRQV